MKVFLVRTIEGKHIQGVFWAASTADLWDAVDEMGDPAYCEYAEMIQPSGLWHDIPYKDCPVLPETLSHECPAETRARADILCAQCVREEAEFKRYFKKMKLVRSGELFPWHKDDQDDLEWEEFDYATEGEGLIARIMRSTSKVQ